VSRRALLALSVLVCALAAAVVIDRPRGAPADLPGRMFPGLAPSAVKRVEIRAPGRSPVVLARDAAGALVLPGLPTDAAAVGDLLSELTLLSSRRRVPPDAEHGLDAPRLTVLVDSRELRIGRRERALGRTWVAVVGEAEHHLVDDWAARALDRSVDELRQRAPFPGEWTRVRVAAGGKTIEIAGRPPLVRVPGGAALADHRKVAELSERIGELRALRFTAAAVGTDPPLVLEVDGKTLWAFGDRGAGERWAVSPIGAMTLSAEAVGALEKLVGEPLSWVDRGMFAAAAGTVREIELRPAVGPALRLERTSGAWLLGGERVDDTAVDAWLRELMGTRAAGVTAAAALTERPAGSDEIVVRGAGTPETVWLVGGTLRRPEEPIALTAPRGVERFFRADPVEFADRTVVSFESSALSEIAVGEERAVRGASLDDWRVVAPLEIAADAAIIDKLRETVAALRARRVVAARPRPEHGLEPPRRAVTLVLAPAPGEDRATTHVLELGAVTATGACYARRRGEGPVVLLSPDDCRALDVRLATRQVFTAGDVVAGSVGGRAIEGDELRVFARALAHAPAVSGYGGLAGKAIVLETSEGPLTLVFRGREYARKDRAVRYRVAAEVCEQWKALCGD